MNPSPRNNQQLGMGTGRSSLSQQSSHQPIASPITRTGSYNFSQQTMEPHPQNIAMNQAFDHSPGMPATPSAPARIDRIVNARHLGEYRNIIYTFSKLSEGDKLVNLFMDSIVTTQKIDRLQSELTKLIQSVAAIMALCQQAWQPSEAQKILLKNIIRHFIIQPVPAYSLVSRYSESYVHKHNARLRLQLYISDSTVHTTVNQFIGNQTHQLKSTFRKSLFALTKKKIDLYSITRSFLDAYHLAEIPKEAPRYILATVALMREVADSLIQKQTSDSKSETGFWKKLNAKLEDLYLTNGNDRKGGEKWKQWESDKIAADLEKYPLPAGGITNEASIVQVAHSEVMNHLQEINGVEFVDSNVSRLAALGAFLEPEYDLSLDAPPPPQNAVDDSEMQLE